MRLVRIWDDGGAICQVPEVPDGRIFDAETGREIAVGTRKWQRAMERMNDILEAA